MSLGMFMPLPLQLSSSGGPPPGALDTQTISVGWYSDYPYDYYGYVAWEGSLTPGYSSIYGGAEIVSFYWVTDWSGHEGISLSIAGATNSGWTTMSNLGFGDLLRSDAAFSTYSGIGNWYWATSFGANPIIDGAITWA